MKYITYIEEDQIITRDDYIKAKYTLSNLNSEAKSNTRILRRLFFDYQSNAYESINFLEGSEENKDIYCICIRDLNFEEIYLEKKGKRNNITYKSIIMITREECNKILTGDITWLKESNEQVLNELYRQITINELIPKMIVDYKRQVYDLPNQKNYVVFDKSIKTLNVDGINFFDKGIPVTERLSKSTIVMRYKQEVIIPNVVTSILQLGENIRSKLAFSI